MFAKYKVYAETTADSLSPALSLIFLINAALGSDDYSVFPCKKSWAAVTVVGGGQPSCFLTPPHTSLRFVGV